MVLVILLCFDWSHLNPAQSEIVRSARNNKPALPLQLKPFIIEKYIWSPANTPIFSPFLHTPHLPTSH